MIVLVLILGFLLRLINLNQSLWLDEAIEVLAVRDNYYRDLIIKYSVGDFHPPLYHVILKFWTSFFGYSEIAARIPSVLFGVLIIFFVYVIGKKLLGRKVGILAAFFLAINPLAIYYSQEARMYALAALTVSMSMYFFIMKKWWYFLLSLVIMLYTDYVPYLVLPVFLFAGPLTKEILLTLWVSLCSLGPWFPFFYAQFRVGTGVARTIPLWGSVVGGLSLKSLPLTLVKFIIGRISLANKVVYAVVITPIAIIYAWIISRAKIKLLWLWFLVPLALGIIISIKVPIFSYFRFLFIVPAFCLILASGTKRFPIGVIFISLVSILSITIFNLNPHFHREDWRAAVAYMENRPGLVVMPSLAQDAPLIYYSKNLAITDSKNLNHEILDLVHPLGNIYIIRYVQEIFDPKDIGRGKIESRGFKKVEEKDFNGVLIWRYHI